MADGLSVAASVVGIATAAIQTVQFLSTTIDNIKDAPETIRNIKLDLQAVELALRNLDMAYKGDESRTILSAEVKTAVDNCTRTCTAFQTLLSHWMRHSTEDKTFWMDRWRVGLVGQERIKTFTGQLNDCKSTLTVALSTTTIITMTRQEGIMQQMKEMMLKQNESVLQREMARANGERAEIESAMQQLSVTDDTYRSEESEQSRRELLQEIRQQVASNDAFRKICEEAISTTVFKRTGQKIKGIKATDHSTAVAGFMNTSGEETKINQDISDVTAGNRSFAGAGLFKNLDFADLRSTAPTDDTANRV